MTAHKTKTWKKSKIDVEKFVAKVQARPGLWDQNDPNYLKRDYLRAAWRDVSREMGVPVDKVKKRWRGLRHTFVNELSKAESNNPEGGGRGSSWIHFPLMVFLGVNSSRRTITQDRATKCKRAKLKSVTGHDGFTGSDDDDSDGMTSYRSSSPASEVQEPISIKVEIEECVDGAEESQEAVSWPVKEESVQESAFDADADTDEQFLQSLLPFLRDVPRKRKQCVRDRLMQVLLDEQN